MANVQGFTRSAVGHVLAHIERRKDRHGEYVRFGNQDIDTSRTHLNYGIRPAGELHDMKPLQRYKKHLAGAKVNNRKDLRVMCSWVITAPKDLRAEDEQKFFGYATKFLLEKYPGFVAAAVHNDESGRPHLHYVFVPLSEGKDGLKVSARDILTRAELKRFHGDLGAYMDQKIGYHISIETGETQGKSLTMLQYKIKQAQQELTDLRKAIQQGKMTLQEVSDRIRIAEEQLQEYAHIADEVLADEQPHRHRNNDFER